MEKDPRHAIEEEAVEEPDTDFKTDFGGQDEPEEQPGVVQKLIKFFTN